MTKMNKTEAVNAAKNLARKSAAVNAMTIDGLNAMDWSARKAVANRYALDEIDGNVIDTLPKYQGDVVNTFIDAAMNLWASKLKALENARRSWKQALSGLTQEQALDKITTLVASMNIRGARVDGHGVQICRLDRYGDAQLYWSFDRDYDAKTTNPDDATQKAGAYSLKLKISCSGTSYSPAEMSVMAKIHLELVDAANEIEVVMARERIIWTYGIPEPVAVVEEAVQS